MYNAQTAHGWDTTFMAQRMPSLVAQHLPPLFGYVFHHNLTDNIHSIKENNFHSICILSLKHGRQIHLSMGMQETSS